MKIKIQPITGDASFRRFYRLTTTKNSKIIVFAERDKYKNLIVYTAVNKFLRRNKILTPRISFYDYSKNIIFIEDFGNLSFYRILLNQKNKFTTYKKLVDILIKIQKIKPPKKLKTTNGKFYTLSRYSLKHLQEESDLFFTWYLPLFLDKRKFMKYKLKLKKILLKLYKKLNFKNTFFVHRDYHVSNLMKVGKKVGIIDSQDAIIGNPTYDLVSLIDDVRIKTPSNLKNKILKYYLNKTSKKLFPQRSKFMEDFNILSVQRNFKIIGIFSRLYLRDKKRKYLKFIPYAWKLMELRMKDENFRELKIILDKIISQKIRKRKNIG